MNKKYYQIMGFFGASCLFFGVVFYFVKREISAYVVINVVSGIALIAAFLYFNLKESARVITSPGKKGSRNLFLRIGIIIGIVILINLLSNIFYFGKDLTRDKISSISDNSQKVVKWIKEPIEILVFSTGEKSDYEKYLLDSYNFYNRNVTYKFLDPERNPQLAQEYGISKTGQAVIKYKDSFLAIPSVNEQNVTNAVIRLTQSVKNYVYFMAMHGEHDLEDLKANQGYGLLWKELQNENYYVSKLKLEAPNYYIPGNCTILVVAGPRKMYTALEVKAIREYLENGGRAIFLIDPNVKTGLEELIADWGISVNNDCMVDVVYPSLVERMIARGRGVKISPRPIFQVNIKDFTENEVTKDLVEKTVIMSVARSLSKVETEKVSINLKVEPLAHTTKMGWGETDLEALFKHGKISSAVSTNRGPLVVAMLSIKGTPEDNSKIIVIGDSDFINNEFVHQLFNRDLFMNSLAYLSKQANLISVRPRHLFASRLDYDPVTMTRIFTASVLIFPQLLLMAGIAIWRLRR